MDDDGNRLGRQLRHSRDTIFGFPVTCSGGDYEIVRNLPIDDFSRACLDKTLAELNEERAGVEHLLG